MAAIVQRHAIAKRKILPLHAFWRRGGWCVLNIQNIEHEIPQVAPAKTKLMDKNTVIGFALILGLLVAMQLVMAPEKKKLEAQQQAHLDSLRRVEQRQADSLASLQAPPVLGDSAQLDSNQAVKLAGQFGAMAPAAVGSEKEEVLETK
jgi:hypothetical protein